MELTCPGCEARIRIADEKIAQSKAQRATCPKCRMAIPLSPPSPASASEDEKEPVEPAVGSSAYDAEEKPFDYIEEEGQTALLCETNETLREIAAASIDDLGYHLTSVTSAREALKKMRYHTYDLIVVNEYFDTRRPESNGILLNLERLSMVIRRDIFVALVSSRYRTMDNLSAFRNSVNLVINEKNMNEIGRILQRGLADHERFYHTYKLKVEELGMA